MTPSHAPRTSPRGLGFWVEVSCPPCGTSKASFQKYHLRVQGGADPKALQVVPRPDAIQAGRVLGKMQGRATNCIQVLATFAKPGETYPQDITILRPGKDWHMVAHLKRRLEFLREIMTATRPDIVLWFAVDGSVLMIKLTISWEEDTRGNTSSMPSLQQSGWKSRVYPVEIGSGGFVAKGLVQLPRIAGMTGTSLEREVRGLGQKAEN